MPKSEPISFGHVIAEQTFSIAGADLLVDGFAVDELAAIYGTPLFVYDATVMRRTYCELRHAVAGFCEVFYSVKANPNPAILRVFVDEGAGLEIASGGEYLRARAAGASPENIYFAGPGKGEDELELAIGQGIGEIHLESYNEIDKVAMIGERLNRPVRVAVRVNPVASAQGGAMRMGGRPAPFGFDEEELDNVVDALRSRPNLDLCGIHLFAGTQILDPNVLVRQWSHALMLAKHIFGRLGHSVVSIDLGGGLGIPYFFGEARLDPSQIKLLIPALSRLVHSDEQLCAARIVIEPGRYLVGPCGIYIARVRAVKVSRGSRFLITDGGMHHHLAASGNLGQIVKRDFPIVAPTRMDVVDLSPCTIVGPLCTPLDTLGRQVHLPDLKAGDLIALLQSGAYGLTASPVEFLSHPTPAEILIDFGKVTLIRERGRAVDL
jgi:diaminopimelate decarboxylase